MPYKRTKVRPGPDRAAVPAWLAGLGFNLAVEPVPDADIELALIGASELGLVGGDLRTLSLLTTWLGRHHTYLNPGRLERLLGGVAEPRLLAYWASIGRWLSNDRRLARLASLYEGEPVGLLATGTEFQIERRGEDPRFAAGPLRVPLGTLRDREEDVLAPEALARRHAGYRNRILMGPSWRAQAWTILERDPDLSVAEVARQAGCAFATAWEASRDFRLLHPR